MRVRDVKCVGGEIQGSKSDGGAGLDLFMQYVDISITCS